KNAILFSLSVASTLFVLKGGVSYWANSLAILASALDSLLDFFSSFINYLSIRIADKPATKKYPFGHGKIEGLAGLFQALFIISSAGVLIKTAVLRFLNSEPISHIPAGVAVMSVSIVASLFLVRHLKSVAKRTQSLTVRADAVHYTTDLLTNAGVIIALGLVHWTGWALLDPIVSLLMTAMVLWSAAQLLKDSFAELMDKAIPGLEAEVNILLKYYEPHLSGCHDFRSRRSGSRKLIEFHLEVDATKSFGDAHELVESLRLAIENKVPNSHVTIHYDPAGFEDRQATVEQKLR
ncbi:MAG: cation diffusion facilitator family transporter, partial [bacterium]|nr:cation diffusion facilitator family transporter [bacterium]